MSGGRRRTAGRSPPPRSPIRFPPSLELLRRARRLSRAGLLAGFAELTPGQKIAARYSLGLVSSYTKLTFIEQPSGLAVDAAIRVARYGDGGLEACPPSDDGRTSGDALFGTNAVVTAQQSRHRPVSHHRARAWPRPRPEARPSRAKITARWPERQRQRILGDDLCELPELARSGKPPTEASGRLLAAELHDVRHRRACRPSMAPISARSAPRPSTAGTRARPAAHQRRGRPNTVPIPRRHCWTKQDFLDCVDAGRHRHLRPQQLHPGPGRRPAARKLAEVLQRPSSPTSTVPSLRARRASSPRATSTTLCSTRAT